MRILFTCLIILLSTSQAAWAQCVNPAGVKGEIVFNDDFNTPQYCDDTNWIAMVGAAAAPNGPQNCPNIGDTCNDGSIYAGLSPDGNVPMYTTPADAGLITWDDGIGNFLDTAMVNCTDTSPGTAASCQTGEANTALLVALNGSGTPAPYAAAEYCNGLTNVLGHSDWYLPAQDELNVLYTNRVAIGGFNISGSFPAGWYWSSSEIDGNDAKNQSFSDGLQSSVGNTSDGLSVRCVRRHEAGEGQSQLTEIVPSGLIGHWRLDETSGTTAFDSSGSGNDAILELADFSTDSVNAQVKTGYSTYVNNNDISVSSAIFPTGVNPPFSFTAWTKKDGTTGSAYFFELTDGAENVTYHLRDFDSNSQSYGNSRLGTIGTSGAPVTPRNIDYPLGEWVHLSIVYDGTTITVYKNGTYSNSEPLAVTFSGTTTVHLVSSDSNEWRGGRDDVRFYNRDLSPAEVREIYEARDGIRYSNAYRVPEYFDGNKFVPMRPEFPDVTDGLVGHWKLDETTGTTATDSAGTNDAAVSGSDFNALSIPAAVENGLRLAPYSLSMPGSLTYSPVIGQSATYSIWFRTRSTNGGDIFLLDEWAGNERGGLRITSSKTSLWAGFRDTNLTTVTGSFASGTNLNDGQWRHAVFIVDRNANQVRAFMNGVEIGAPINISTLIGARIGFNDANISVGPGSLHLADFDDVRIYDRALSLTEVQTLYQMGTPVGSSTALPQGCSTIGDVCDDGTIYAGLSPDGSVEMFTTPTDQSNAYWGTYNFTTGSISSVTGEANTADVYAHVLAGDGSFNPDNGYTPNAFVLCHDLRAHRYEDWYLPALDELSVLYMNKNAGNLGGTFNETPGWYSASMEVTNTIGAAVRFSDGSAGGFFKDSLRAIRCVRKGPAPRCANPYGLEGAFLYNDDHSVVQYCDGARWIAIGKRAQ